MSGREIRELLEKAERSLDAAEILLKQGYYDFAISRSYYAMFYSAQAILLTKDVRRTKHSGIIAAFNELFVHAGQLPHEFFIALRDAFEDRAEGDYGLSVISEEQATLGLAEARKFVAEIGKRLDAWLESKSQ
jgi:uncharacterized protein (UPF0332 family)